MLLSVCSSRVPRSSARCVQAIQSPDSVPHAGNASDVRSRKVKKLDRFIGIGGTVTRPPLQLPYLPLATQQSLRCNAPFRLFSVADAEAQKLALRWSRHRALGLIYLELEPSPDKARDAFHHPPPRSDAAHVDVAIVRIAHEAMPAPLQLSI